MEENKRMEQEQRVDGETLEKLVQTLEQMSDKELREVDLVVQGMQLARQMSA